MKVRHSNCVKWLLLLLYFTKPSIYMYEHNVHSQTGPASGKPFSPLFRPLPEKINVAICVRATQSLPLFWHDRRGFYPQRQLGRR